LVRGWRANGAASDTPSVPCVRTNHRVEGERGECRCCSRPITAPVATPTVATSTPAVSEPTQTIAPVTGTRAPFSSIGSAPVVDPVAVPPVIPAPPATAIVPSPSAAVPVAAAPAPSFVPPSGPQQEVARRRRWPLALLALLTILGSGALSWGVATWVNNNDEPVVATEVADSDDSADADETVGATAQPAMEDASTSTTPAQTSQSVTGLDNEPFARAAETIRPSVVQLNLGQGLGTGVIIDDDGTILTAAHVVGNATDVQVTFFDGSSVDGTVVGTHGPTDVAVVRVDPAGRDLVPAALAEGDDVRVGQLAVAVGSPFGFDQTVTAGIISAVDRLIPGSDASFVQTDAPINPGNSGGPLINLNGEVVGINDLIFTESGSSAGVGFAISIDLAVIIADQLIAGVEPRVALLGVGTAPPANGARGAQVDSVVEGSAADQAGLQIGDIVLSLNGVNTRGSGDLRAQVIDQAPGSTVEITVSRDGEEVSLTATLGQTGG